MKIALISPFPPYRGGISKYSKNLYDVVSKDHDILIYNFTRLYPEIFFPGQNQYETDDTLFNKKNIVRIIDSINPSKYGYGPLYSAIFLRCFLAYSNCLFAYKNLGLSGMIVMNNIIIIELKNPTICM